MKKALTILIILMLIFSLSGCCVAAVAAGLGVGIYLLLTKYGPLLYFGDFWATYGTTAATAVTEGGAGSTIDSTLFEAVTDPVTSEISHILKISGTQKFEKADTIGKFASYSGTLNFVVISILPDDYIEGSYFVDGAVFESMSLTGDIAIEDHDATYAKIVGWSKFIYMEDTSVGTDGAVLEGVVKVDTLVLDLADYASLISDVREMDAP